jgi:hypothetical protein
MVNTNFTTGGVLGAKFGETHTEAKFALGTHALGNGNSEWVYVHASAVSVTQYDAVKISVDHKVAQLTIDTGKEPVDVAFAQVAFAPGDYGWVMVRGRPLVRLAADCEPNLAIYATASGGIVDDATVSTMIQGLVATTSVTGATTAATCVANFPTLVRAAALNAI